MDMRTKALPLVLLMIVSGLAGCIEDPDVDSDTTDGITADDRSGNISTIDDLGVERIEIQPTNPDDCNSGGGTWIEASERGGESYCDIGDENESSETGEITQEDCGRRNGTWIETSNRSREPYCDFGENDRNDGDEDRQITQEDCERRNGTWTEAPDRPREYYCDFGDRDNENIGDENRFRYSNIIHY